MASSPPPPSVTELSRLRVRPEVDEIQRAAIGQLLDNAKHAMQRFTGRPFFLFMEISDRNQIYIVGAWDSIEQHRNEWIPSQQNQDFLRELAPYVEVDFLFHLDFPLEEMPFYQQVLGDGDRVFSCEMYHVELFKRLDFEMVFRKRRHCWETHSAGAITGAWRIDAELNMEEFVVLCPWNNLAHHKSFPDTPEFQGFGDIRCCVDSHEVAHLKAMPPPPARPNNQP